ncbi:binding-protein-dependent transport systems inner membrane component [Beutenbergia cavernae DSM 12333]|uniref:Binding-protein-dependent transport systems inner membrane component n=1 Tax=Beutenbergia cavernae (strain ATCC BAA-8 / DSM 12333 / CCUG 43141 / JCM 11478 / NBRC 16432 / NCIMB 13614 / HKI 0122) TaxID=471853 RepID=C5C544_BEUC1|nr:carbohydrate ABC transporter permease [Beutenbergia cavernae]ACQ82184.1 binding-protein-dependent transport systems inner membrane component [Beutenbergia cavernae DSM 12333]
MSATTAPGLGAGADAAAAVTAEAGPPPPPRRRRGGPRGASRRLRWWHVALLPIAFLWVYPFLWMVTASFKTQREMLLGGLGLWPSEWTLENFQRAWTTGRFGDFTVNTLTFSIAVVVIVVLVSSLAGYALADRQLPGRKVVMGVLVAAMFVPHGYTIIPVFQLVTTLGLQNGLLGAALAQAAGVAVPVLLYVGFFSGIPGELEEAAKVDGAGYLRRFRSIMFPLARPVTGTVVLLNFIGAWNAFFIPLVFTLGRPDLRTLGVGMYNFFGTDTTDWAGLAAGASISVVPIIIVFLFLQKSFVEGVAGAVKS